MEFEILIMMGDTLIEAGDSEACDYAVAEELMKGVRASEQLVDSRPRVMRKLKAHGYRLVLDETARIYTAKSYKG